jgi:hypothetical protein
MSAGVAAIVLFTALFLVLGYWQVRAQLHYLDAMDARRGTRLGLDHEADLVARNPLGALLGVPHRSAMRSWLTHQRRDDPDLEALRRQSFLRRNVWLAASILGFIALAVALGRPSS